MLLDKVKFGPVDICLDFGVVLKCKHDQMKVDIGKVREDKK